MTGLSRRWSLSKYAERSELSSGVNCHLAIRTHIDFLPIPHTSGCATLPFTRLGVAPLCDIPRGTPGLDHCGPLTGKVLPGLSFLFRPLLSWSCFFASSPLSWFPVFFFISGVVHLPSPLAIPHISGYPRRLLNLELARPTLVTRCNCAQKVPSGPIAPLQS